MLELVQSYFGIEPEDDSRKRREKVNGKVLTLDRTLEDALPPLLGLLGLNEGDDPLAGMDAQVRRQRMLEALKRLLLRESLNQALIVIFEDLHWIDQETQAFLNLLADSIGTAKVFAAGELPPGVLAFVEFQEPLYAASPGPIKQGIGRRDARRTPRSERTQYR